mgnify:CR=1 FL=1
MENTPIKLAPPLPAWHGFEDNQVLTADLLNDTTRYLDVQTRRGRVALTGVGVVTGLNPAVEGNAVRVSRGFGLTSDGDLLFFPEAQTFGKAAEFVDPKGLYGPFRNDGALVPLWELLPADSTQPDALPLPDFFAQHPADELMAVLYAEQFLEKHEICRADRCDAAGVTLEDHPRLLLVSREAAKRLLDTGAATLPDLPPLAVRRVKFSEKITQFNQLAGAYQAALKPTLADLTEALTSADAALGALLTRWQTAMGLPFAGVGAGGGAALADQLIGKITAVQNGHLVQYAYDALRDVASAYNEFREAFDGLNLSALPAPEAFAKHLLLGSLQPAADEFRSAFQPSVAQDGVLQHLETALNLYRRLARLVETFEPNQALDRVTVTPSAGSGAPLGERAIPVYYRADALVADWQAHRRGPKPPVLSCHGASYSRRPEVLNPLDFDWPGADFYRIEGHLNGNFTEVKTRLDALRREQDLPFDVIGIQIEEDARTVRWPPVFQFPALDWALHTQKASFLGKISHLTAFNDELGQRLDEAVGSADVEPLADALGGRTELKRKHDETKNLQTALTRHAQTLRGALDDEGAGPLRELHSQLSPVAAQLNLSAKPFVNASVAAQTPLDAQSLHVAPHLLDYLRDQRRQQETEARGRFFFDNFLRDHPALLHAGGVPVGGTFCLVYRQDGLVVADFYLPHAWQPAAPLEPFKPLPLPEFKPPLPFKPLLQFDREQPKILLKKDLPEVVRTVPDLVESKINPVKTDLLGQLGQINVRFDSTLAEVGTRIDGLHQNVDAKLEASRADFTARVGSVAGEVQGVSKRVDEQVQSFVANYQKTVESSQKLADQYAVVIGKNAQRTLNFKDVSEGVKTFVDDDGKEKVAIEPEMFSKFVRLAAQDANQPPVDRELLKRNSDLIRRSRPDLFRLNQ